MKKRTRGGQKKHWAEKARVLAWYTMVRRESGLNDYQLDFDFAWRDSAIGERVSGSARPRTFEWIRKTGRQPKGMDQRWRNMEMLVEAVDQDIFLRGTKSLYTSKIWEYFQTEVFQPRELQDSIELLLEKLGLAEVEIDDVSPNSDVLLNEFGVIGLYDRCVRLSLRELDQPTRIELIWLLYVQAESAHVGEYRVVLELLIDKLLDDFFAYHIPSRALEFYSKSVTSLMNARQLHSNQSWSILDSSVRKLIVPIKLIGQLELSHFAVTFRVWRA